MKFLTLLVMVAPSMAFAHVEMGTYVGKTESGEECSMVAVRSYFESDVPHPLNERVVIQVGQDEFTVGHPAVIDETTPTASFNHDAFHGVKPTSVGARALVVKMSHEEGHEGPTAFHLIEHQWRANQRTVVHCLGIALKK